MCWIFMLCNRIKDMSGGRGLWRSQVQPPTPSVTIASTRSGWPWLCPPAALPSWGNFGPNIQPEPPNLCCFQLLPLATFSATAVKTCLCNYSLSSCKLLLDTLQPPTLNEARAAPSAASGRSGALGPGPSWEPSGVPPHHSWTRMGRGDRTGT